MSLLKDMDFGDEAGENVNPEELEHCFVEQETSEDFLNAKKKIIVITAKKGIGKSALIKWTEGKLQKASNTLVISCRGNDLVRGNFKLTNKLQIPNDYIQDWKIRICALINRSIGKELQIAFSDDRMTLVESAEIAGFKQKNLLSALTERLTKLFPKLEAKKISAANEIELLKRYKGDQVWLLVDDLDSTYQRTEKENLELSTFFSACRILSSEVKGLSIRVTMRTDVWPLIRRYDESLDKVEQYIRNITWTEDDFRTLLYKRVKYEMDSQEISVSPPPHRVSAEEAEEFYIDKIFEKRMPWGDKDKRTYLVIYTISYSRPRWAIQLCKLAQKAALQRGESLMSKIDIDSVWSAYGVKRIADVAAEYKHQCSQVEELVNAFRGCQKHMTREELLLWIKNKISTHVTPVIDGTAQKDPLGIANFLFRIGFIVARSEYKLPGDPTPHYEHYDFAAMPDFLSTRTNMDHNMIWEIHPCYREALDIVKLNESNRKERMYRRKR
jgi:hypothetical protein